MKNYGTVKERVKIYLTRNWRMRDDVNNLVAHMWADDLKRKGYSANSTLIELSNGNLTSFKTIDRAWRQVQEQNESLRGEKWKIRQGKLQEAAKKELGYRTKET